MFYFSWSLEKHSQPKHQPPNLIFFFSSMYFINPFSRLLALRSSVGSTLLRKRNPPRRCCVDAETRRPPGWAQQRKPLCNPAREPTHCVLHARSAPALLKHGPSRNAAGTQAGCLQGDSYLGGDEKQPFQSRAQGRSSCFPRTCHLATSYCLTQAGSECMVWWRRQVLPGLDSTSRGISLRRPDFSP